VIFPAFLGILLPKSHGESNLIRVHWLLFVAFLALLLDRIGPIIFDEFLPFHLLVIGDAVVDVPPAFDQPLSRVLVRFDQQESSQSSSPAADDEAGPQLPLPTPQTLSRRLLFVCRSSRVRRVARSVVRVGRVVTFRIDRLHSGLIVVQMVTDDVRGRKRARRDLIASQSYSVGLRHDGLQRAVAVVSQLFAPRRCQLTLPKKPTDEAPVFVAGVGCSSLFGTPFVLWPPCRVSLAKQPMVTRRSARLSRPNRVNTGLSKSFSRPNGRDCTDSECVHRSMKFSLYLSVFWATGVENGVVWRCSGRLLVFVSVLLFLLQPARFRFGKVLALPALAGGSEQLGGVPVQFDEVHAGLQAGLTQDSHRRPVEFLAHPVVHGAAPLVGCDSSASVPEAAATTACSEASADAVFAFVVALLFAASGMLRLQEEIEWLRLLDGLWAGNNDIEMRNSLLLLPPILPDVVATTAALTAAASEAATAETIERKQPTVKKSLGGRSPASDGGPGRPQRLPGSSSTSTVQHRRRSLHQSKFCSRLRRRVSPILAVAVPAAGPVLQAGRLALIRMEERDEKSNDASLLPPKFSGQSNVHFWLSIFEDFAEDKNWDDAKRASKVKLLLRGEAQVCVWDMSDADKKSYEKIKALLLQQYGGSANQHRAMQEFQGRQRKNGESIRELSFALRLLYMGARPDDPSTLRDREVKFRIIQLLSAGIREALLKESDSDTCTLGTLVERATRLEQVMSKNTPASSSMVSVVDDRLSRLEQQLETLTAAVTSGAARGGRAGPGDRRQAQRTSGCYQCGKDGHIARRCPTKGAHKQGRCFNCSGWGHNAATAHSVFVRALLQEKPVCFLLDTGAQTSLISHSLMRSCGLQLESGSSCCPTSVDGSRLQCLGTARGTVQVGETTRLDHVFNVVEGISVDLILGMDFIGRATSELRININNKTVFFNDEAVPFFTNSSKIQMVTGTLVARIECNINVPARSEKLVWLRVKSKDEQGVFEPNAEFTQETGLLASRVLALSADQRIPVLMCNLGSEAVTLYANKAVGEFEAADVLEPVGNVKEKLKNWDVNPELTELERDKLMTILKANDDLFSTHEFDLGSTSFNFTLCYRPGRENVVPDMLSRTATTQLDSSRDQDFLEEQQRDALLQSVFKALTEGREHLSNSGQQKVEEFLGDDGIEIGPHGALVRQGKPVVPSHLRAEFLADAHDAAASGHLGADRTLQKLRERCWWPKMQQDVQNWLPHTNSGASDTLEYVEDVQKRLLQSRRLVHQKLQSAQTERNERYNKDVRFQPYNQGDLVMLSCKTVKPGRSKSLSNRWTGPYVVLKRLGEVNYRVRLAPGLAVRRRRKLVVHHDRLKPFVKRRGSLQLTDEQQPAPATSTSPEQLGVPDAWAQLSGGNDDDDGDTEAAIDPVVPPALRRSLESKGSVGWQLIKGKLRKTGSGSKKSHKMPSEEQADGLLARKDWLITGGRLSGELLRSGNVACRASAMDIGGPSPAAVGSRTKPMKLSNCPESSISTVEAKNWAVVDDYQQLSSLVASSLQDCAGACEQTWDPVCGTDDRTYPNRCAAKCSGTDVSHDGQCKNLMNSGAFACTDSCEQKWDQVCGSNGRTYANKCIAKCAGVSVKHTGRCRTFMSTAAFACTDSCEQKWDPVCGSDGRTYANKCIAKCAGVSVVHNGRCKTFMTGAAFACTDKCEQKWDPVCGSNGRTYANKCIAKCAGVSVKHTGRCRTFSSGAFESAIPTSGDSYRPKYCSGEYDPVCGVDNRTYANACLAQLANVAVKHAGPCMNQSASSESVGRPADSSRSGPLVAENCSSIGAAKPTPDSTGCSGWHAAATSDSPTAPGAAAAEDDEEEARNQRVRRASRSSWRRRTELNRLDGVRLCNWGCCWSDSTVSGCKSTGCCEPTQHRRRAAATVADAGDADLAQSMRRRLALETAAAWKERLGDDSKRRQMVEMSTLNDKSPKPHSPIRLVDGCQQRGLAVPAKHAVRNGQQKLLGHIGSGPIIIIPPIDGPTFAKASNNALHVAGIAGPPEQVVDRHPVPSDMNKKVAQRHEFQTSRLRGHELLEMRQLDRFPDLRVGVLLSGVQRAREKHGVLRDDGQLGPEVVQAETGDVNAVNFDSTSGRFENSKQGQGERALARADVEALSKVVEHQQRDEQQDELLGGDPDDDDGSNHSAECHQPDPQCQRNADIHCIDILTESNVVVQHLGGPVSAQRDADVLQQHEDRLAAADGAVDTQPEVAERRVLRAVDGLILRPLGQPEVLPDLARNEQRVGEHTKCEVAEAERSHVGLEDGQFHAAGLRGLLLNELTPVCRYLVRLVVQANRKLTLFVALLLIVLFFEVLLNELGKASVVLQQLAVPTSDTLPSFSTTMRSILGRNEMPCVTNSLVLLLSKPLGPSTCSKMCLPTWESTADRGSSRKYRSVSEYTARAREIRCFWPPDKQRHVSSGKDTSGQTGKKSSSQVKDTSSQPTFSPISVSKPPGRILMSGLSAHAEITRSNVVFWKALPKVMLSRRVAFWHHACWVALVHLHWEFVAVVGVAAGVHCIGIHLRYEGLVSIEYILRRAEHVNRKGCQGDKERSAEPRDGAGSIQFPNPAGNDSVHGNEQHHDKQAGQHRWPQLQPEEVQGQRDDNWRPPQLVQKCWRVLQLLGVDGHQVDDFAHGFVFSSRAGQSEGFAIHGGDHGALACSCFQNFCSSGTMYPHVSRSSRAHRSSPRSSLVRRLVVGPASAAAVLSEGAAIDEQLGYELHGCEGYEGAPGDQAKSIGIWQLEGLLCMRRRSQRWKAETQRRNTAGSQCSIVYWKHSVRSGSFVLTWDCRQKAKAINICSGDGASETAQGREQRPKVLKAH
uniref:CCHC-type domain-containing protein n=1 Tax=Macrostomum lignano TaxID=282301 RepID=A0A1I8HVJ8_9PLAT